MTDPQPSLSAPRLPALLGPAGLLPPVGALLVAVFAPVEWRFAGVTVAQFYAAAILSFLGGIWWGLAARADRAPDWLWLASVLPSLWATGALILLVFGWNDAALLILAAGVLLALFVDRRMRDEGLMPGWLWHLRVRLSVWLAALTAAMTLVG